MPQPFTELVIAKDGIFPIVKDACGRLLSGVPASGFHFPGTIQGEGKLNGIPSLFIRLAGCNLHCNWKNENGTISECDTAYASYRLSGTQHMTVNEISDIIQHNTDVIDHLVITGGEPFLQAPALTELCKRLKQKRNYHITIETNATLFDPELSEQIDLFSLSPKLASSVPLSSVHSQHESRRIQPAIIQDFMTHALNRKKEFQLKFVYAAEPDITEIQTLLSQLKGWSNSDILLMPLGATSADLQDNCRQTLRHCLLNGWRYCDRLHISLFGAKDGV